MNLHPSAWRTRNLALGISMVLLAMAGFPMAAEPEIDERERVAEQIVAATQVDRLMLALAQSKLSAEPEFQKKLDYMMFELRPPALWNDQHPAWAPARSALIGLARGESCRWVKEYWATLHPITVQNVQYGFTPPETEMLRIFVESSGGKAWFEKRLAEVRLRNGEALFDLDPESPAELARHAQEARKKFNALSPAEKQKIEVFLANAKCPECARPPAKVMEDLITHDVDWLAGVLAMSFRPQDWRIVEGWIAELNTKLGNQLPVDSKKQLLGRLEMGKDSILTFRFHFYWKDKPDGGALALELPRTHPNYAEVLALAPGLSAGQSRVLYRDKSGVISDQP